MSQVKEKVCLIVHDGWGISTETEGNAIAGARTEVGKLNMDKLGEEHSHRILEAHGSAVGLNDGLMGNSEVGHLNIGAGRIVWQDIVRIDVAIKKRQFHKEKYILESLNHAKDGNGRLHFIGLISDGGVHSHIRHLYALLEAAKEQGVPEVYVHFIADGRDTAPRSAAGYCQDLLDFMSKEKYGVLATIVGRYYAMDRDTRWERVKIAVDGFVGGVGDEGPDAVAAIKKNYEADLTDEFLKPIIVNGEAGRIKENDTIFMFNYRADRVRELSSVLGLLVEKPDMKGVDITVPTGLNITTMSQYKAEYPFSVAFPPQPKTNVLAEWLGAKGIKQAHIAETEKYAHVTFFFNGGKDAQFSGETRYLVPSPKHNVNTYNELPRMSVQPVADTVANAVKGLEVWTEEDSKNPGQPTNTVQVVADAKEVLTYLDGEGKEASKEVSGYSLKTREEPKKGENFDFVMCNFAPPDMVGHTGIYEAAIKAIKATDKAVGTVYEACQKAGYFLLITSDHGNAEQMKDLSDPAKPPHTAHTCNPVPFILVAPPGKEGLYALKSDAEGEDPGALADVAPTILDLMGLPQPEEMTGRSLLVRKN